MALFTFKKKEETRTCCCGSAPVKAEPACACNSGAPNYEANSCCCEDGECSIQSMKVLGAGCKTCHAQFENCQAAVKEMGMQLEVEYITDMEKVMAYGVMSMPGIVVNEKVVSTGKLLKAEDVTNLLKKLGYC